MTTALSLQLSTTQPVWGRIFELQSASFFADAMALLPTAPRPDLAIDLFAQVFEANLRFCVNALHGALPTQQEASSLIQLAFAAGTRGFSDVQIEAWLLIFDVLEAHHDEAFGELSKLEVFMDSNTVRRWHVRKARSLSHSGNISEAYELLLSHAPTLPDQDLDNDDSLCALLIEFGRIATELGKYSDAVDIYNQAVNCARSTHNQGLSLIRLSNALERMSRPAQADKRRIEYFNLIRREYPTQCASCSIHFGKEPKFLIPCCKTIVHSECLRQVVSEIEESETSCPFCTTIFRISDVVDPNAVEGRKYKRSKKGGSDITIPVASEPEIQPSSII